MKKILTTLLLFSSILVNAQTVNTYGYNIPDNMMYIENFNNSIFNKNIPIYSGIGAKTFSLINSSYATIPLSTTNGMLNKWVNISNPTVADRNKYIKMVYEFWNPSSGTYQTTTYGNDTLEAIISRSFSIFKDNSYNTISYSNFRNPNSDLRVKTYKVLPNRNIDNKIVQYREFLLNDGGFILNLRENPPLYIKNDNGMKLDLAIPSLKFQNLSYFNEDSTFQLNLLSDNFSLKSIPIGDMSTFQTNQSVAGYIAYAGQNTSVNYQIQKDVVAFNKGYYVGSTYYGLVNTKNTEYNTSADASTRVRQIADVYNSLFYTKNYSFVKDTLVIFKTSKTLKMNLFANINKVKNRNIFGYFVPFDMRNNRYAFEDYFTYYHSNATPINQDFNGKQISTFSSPYDNLKLTYKKAVMVNDSLMNINGLNIEGEFLSGEKAFYLKNPYDIVTNNSCKYIDIARMTIDTVYKYQFHEFYANQINKGKILTVIVKPFSFVTATNSNSKICNPQTPINLRSLLTNYSNDMYFTVNGKKVTETNDIIKGADYGSTLVVTASYVYDNVIYTTDNSFTITVYNPSINIATIPNQCPTIGEWAKNGTSSSVVNLSNYITFNNPVTSADAVYSYKYSSAEKGLIRNPIAIIKNQLATDITDTLTITYKYNIIGQSQANGAITYGCTMIEKEPFLIHPKPSYTFSTPTKNICFKSGTSTLDFGLTDKNTASKEFWYGKRVELVNGVYLFQSDSLKTNPTISSKDTVYYRGISTNGCVNDSARYVVTILNQPTIIGNFADTSICLPVSIFKLPLNNSGGIWSGTNVTKNGIYYYFDASTIVTGTNLELKFDYTASNTCSNSKTKKIILKNNLYYDSTFVQSQNVSNYFCLGDSLKLKAYYPNVAVGVLKYNWYNFISDTKPFSVKDSITGLYNKTYSFYLSNIDASGCESKKSRFSYFLDSAYANITTPLSFIPNYSLVQIKSNSSSNVIKWDWTFSDGRKATRKDPVIYVYEPSDSLSATLEITTNKGCVRKYSTAKDFLLTNGNKLGIITAINNENVSNCYTAINKIICPNNIDAIEIYNSSGIAIFTTNNYDNTIYELSDLASGLYIIKYLSNNQFYTQKIIIE